MGEEGRPVTVEHFQDSGRKLGTHGGGTQNQAEGDGHKGTVH